MNNFEKQGISIIKNVIKERRSRFEERGLVISDIEFRSSGDSKHYFSEVECNIWKGNNIVSIFSIILYMEGKQLLEIEELDSETNNELDRLLLKN